jgi:hypothetical protein
MFQQSRARSHLVSNDHDLFAFGQSDDPAQMVGVHVVPAGITRVCLDRKRARHRKFSAEFYSVTLRGRPATSETHNQHKRSLVVYQTLHLLDIALPPLVRQTFVCPDLAILNVPEQGLVGGETGRGDEDVVPRRGHDRETHVEGVSRAVTLKSRRNNNDQHRTARDGSGMLLLSLCSLA